MLWYMWYMHDKGLLLLKILINYYVNQIFEKSLPKREISSGDEEYTRFSIKYISLVSKLNFAIILMVHDPVFDFILAPRIAPAFSGKVILKSASNEYQVVDRFNVFISHTLAKIFPSSGSIFVSSSSFRNISFFPQLCQKMVNHKNNNK